MHIYGAGANFASFDKSWNGEFHAYLRCRRSCCFICETAEKPISCVFTVPARMVFFCDVGRKRSLTAYVRCLRPVCDRRETSKKPFWASTARPVEAKVKQIHAYLWCSRHDSTSQLQSPRPFLCVYTALRHDFVPAAGHAIVKICAGRQDTHNKLMRMCGVSSWLVQKIVNFCTCVVKHFVRIYRVWASMLFSKYEN